MPWPEIGRPQMGKQPRDCLGLGWEWVQGTREPGGDLPSLDCEQLCGFTRSLNCSLRSFRHVKSHLREGVKLHWFVSLNFESTSLSVAQAEFDSWSPAS